MLSDEALDLRGRLAYLDDAPDEHRGRRAYVKLSRRRRTAEDAPGRGSDE